MAVDAIALITIIGMALGTYLTRVGGFWLVDRLTPSRFLASTLEYLPGTLLIALVAPELAKGGPVEWTAAVVTALLMHRSGNLMLALAGGTATIWLLRQL